MKEIKDFIHLYLGCPFIYNDGSKVWDGWTGFEKTDTWYYDDEERNHIKLGGHLFQVKLIKPILRNLSDMTDEEFDEILRIGEHRHNGHGLKGFIAGWRAFGAETFLYLTQHLFDLYGLIEVGLAIDKNTLK